MRSCIIFISLFLLICPNTNGQFQRMRKGDASIYTESVNIELSTYRAIRSKNVMADSLVNVQRLENRQQEAIIGEQSKTISLQSVIIVRQDSTIIRKDQVITDLNKNFTGLVDTVDKGGFLRTIFDSKWTYLILGAAGTLAIKKL